MSGFRGGYLSGIVWEGGMGCRIEGVIAGGSPLGLRWGCESWSGCRVVAGRGAVVWGVVRALGVLFGESCLWVVVCWKLI